MVTENWVSDLRIATLTPNTPQSGEVTVAAITEDTLARLPYRSPVDRQFLTQLLKTLQSKKVRALGVDLLLDQPTEPDKDAELKTYLNSTDTPIVVAWGDKTDGLTDRQISFMDQFLSDVPRGWARFMTDPHDGTVRTMIIRSGNSNGISELSLAAALVNVLDIGLPEKSRLPINFRGLPDDGGLRFATFPAHSIQYLPDDWFEGRIVLVGADLPLDDRHRTPLSIGANGASMAGVHIHAHALSQLLTPTQPRYLSWLENFGVYVFFSVLGVLLALVRSSVLVRLLFGFSAIVFCWAAGAVLFNRTGIMIPLVMPSVAFMISAGTVTALMWREEWHQRKFITMAFGKYLSPTVIDRIVADPGQLTLIGERREMTFLFTDLSGFTGLSEKTDPEILVAVLNRYLDKMCDIAIQHKGTIDKMVGDALHVIFNAPLDQADHTEQAVRCALAMDQFSQSYRAEKKAEGIDLGITRIGINTGMATVGNFGGDNRFDYTAYGDAINVTARLESANKNLGTRICVSQTTVDQTSNVQFRPIGDLILKGKSESVSVYEPYDTHAHDDTSFEEYEIAFQALRDNDPGVRALFNELTEKYPNDSLIKFHSRRLNCGEAGYQITMKEK